MDTPVQCCRCRNKHMRSERIDALRNGIMVDQVCPRCRCRNFYDLTPQAAWCFADGSIAFGDEIDMPSGAILIARGSKSFLRGVLSCASRYDYKRNILIIPGVSEAETQEEKGDALAEWLRLCSKENGKKYRRGVVFATSKE